MITIVLFSCNTNVSDEKNRYEGQVKFNKEAMKLQQQADEAINEMTESKYIEALTLLDKSISLDSSYFMAYASKASVLVSLKRYNEAIKVLNFLVNKVKPDYAEGFSFLGLLYDKFGNDDSANLCYQKAIRIYTDKIKSDSDITIMVNM